MVEQVGVCDHFNRTVSLLIVSRQVPLKFGINKTKGAHPASKQTGPSPAQRIAIQLANRIPKPTSQQSQTPPFGEDDAESQYDNPYIDNGEVKNIVSDSSTEPESEDEEAKREWKERKLRKNLWRLQRRVMNEGERDNEGTQGSLGHRHELYVGDPQENETFEERQDIQEDGRDSEPQRGCEKNYGQATAGERSQGQNRRETSHDRVGTRGQEDNHGERNHDRGVRGLNDNHGQKEHRREKTYDREGVRGRDDNRRERNYDREHGWDGNRREKISNDNYGRGKENAQRRCMEVQKQGAHFREPEVRFYNCQSKQH